MESLPFQYQKRPHWQFHCLACKKERRSTYWPSPRKRHYAQMGALVFCVTTAAWTTVGFKGLFLIFPIWAAFELVYRAAARQSFICPHCAFDPFLFKNDPKKARAKMDAHFAVRRRKIADRQKVIEERFGPGSL